MINAKSKIFIAGHKGMLGSAILRKLKEKGYKNLITIDKKIRFTKPSNGKKIF